MKQLDDKIFSIISHDLKSPFNSLLGFTKLLKDNFDKYDDKKKKQIIDILYKTSLDAHRLADNLVLWRYAQTGQLNFRSEKIVLFEFVNASIERLKKHAESKGITLSNEVFDNVIVEGDREMLAAIIHNLVSNAIKYTSKNGKVEIKAEKKSSTIEIQVLDNGVGVPEEIQKELFTLNKETVRIGTDNEKGSGLGLVISKLLVEKHEGKIGFKSKVLQGSTFYFTIPIKEELTKKLSNSKTNDAEKPTILIAEDDDANYLLLDTLLNDYSFDFDIIHVVNGKEAVTVANEIPDISLVLMDMNMPIMDGYKATAIIKEKHPNLPIIAQTAYTSREDKEKAITAGCDDIISKPIDVEKLYLIIKKLLG